MLGVTDGSDGKIKALISNIEAAGYGQLDSPITYIGVPVPSSLALRYYGGFAP